MPAAGNNDKIACFANRTINCGDERVRDRSVEDRPPYRTGKDSPVYVGANGKTFASSTRHVTTRETVVSGLLLKRYVVAGDLKAARASMV